MPLSMNDILYLFNSMIINITATDKAHKKQHIELELQWIYTSNESELIFKISLTQDPPFDSI